MHSHSLFSPVLSGKSTKLRRKIMKFKMTGTAGLVGAFVAGMLAATVLGGGTTGKGGGDVLPVGPAAEHDDRSAIVFADSVGACEGVGGKR
jgi:hypothetical protein